MADQLPYLYLNAFMAKEEYNDNDYESFLNPDAQVSSYPLDDSLDIDGILFIKRSQEKKPKWAVFAETLAGVKLDELLNKSSSAVLLLKANGDIFAITFGYGRHLIDQRYFISDFGIKTALNTLKHDSLRSVDLYTVQDQALQRKAQAVRASDIGVFGIDVSRDVLRAVTGLARDGVNFLHISGGDSVYSFGVHMKVSDLPQIAATLANFYSLEHYKLEFLWVDNIRRLKDPEKIEQLDASLLNAIREKDHDAVAVTIPEIVAWDTVYGFSFTRSKRRIAPTLNAENYLENVDSETVTIDSVKNDRLFIFDLNENESSHSVYKCLYFEVIEAQMTYVFFSGEWYEINNEFKSRIDTTLRSIPISRLVFPPVYVWNEDGKEQIESEGDYNTRAAESQRYFLLDKKLVKSNRTTTPIELCDLLTRNKEFVHVKHRKGGSAGLSHLFAQGSVSAEVLLGDRDFRLEARRVLRRVDGDAAALVPSDGFRSSDNEIVYLILGESSETLKNNLPFFSKVNLSMAFENLTQRGYRVSISGVPTISRDEAQLPVAGHAPLPEELARP